MGNGVFNVIGLVKRLCAARLTERQPLAAETAAKDMGMDGTGQTARQGSAANADAKRMSDAITKTVVNTDYDFIMRIHLRQNSFSVFCSKDKLGLPKCGDDYVHMMQSVNLASVAPDNAARAIRDMMPETMEENLKKAPAFSAVYLFLADNAYKKITYTWLDRELGQVILTQTDVSGVVREQQRAQALLTDALHQAEQASSAKTDFLSKMSHEIRTPMNAIIGLSQLGMDAAVCDEARQYFTDIHDAGDFLLGIINDILDMSRIEQGRLELHEEYIDGPNFLRGIEVVMRPVADAQNVQLVVDMSRAKTPWVKMDKLRSQQIYINLLNNAIKFSYPGGVVEWTVADTILDDTQMHFIATIRDYGCGMSQEFMEHLYEPFVQENNGRSNVRQGTGLGLAIVKNIVEKMGGSIEIKSEVGKGTEVTFELTREYAETQPAENAVALPAQEKTELAGKRALLAEDHLLNVKVATRLLEGKGIQVEVAENGLEAVEMFTTRPDDYYDLILMDIQMPVMDGLEAARSIRRLEKSTAQTIPILAMSANAFDDDVEKSRAAGMNAHLSKPIEPRLLYETLARFC